MLFANNIPFVDGSRAEINYKLKILRDELESKVFRLGRLRTEYITCSLIVECKEVMISNYWR